MQDFVDTNITGTLVLLEEAVAAGVECFLYTSTTTRSGGTDSCGGRAGGVGDGGRGGHSEEYLWRDEACGGEFV